jgi:hypothetical protein
MGVATDPAAEKTNKIFSAEQINLLHITYFKHIAGINSITAEVMNHNTNKV